MQLMNLDNKISDEGIFALTMAIKKNQSLKKMYIHDLSKGKMKRMYF